VVMTMVAKTVEMVTVVVLAGGDGGR
jgi:hypothetical protein